MNARLLEIGRDYPEICEWWRAHGWQYVPVRLLPRLGAVVEDEKMKYCAGFLYTAEAGWGWLEWVVTNPEAPLRPRAEAVNVLVKSLIDAGRAAGMVRIISSLHSKGLVRVFQKHGFRQGDTGATEMIWGTD